MGVRFGVAWMLLLLSLLPPWAAAVAPEIASDSDALAQRAEWLLLERNWDGLEDMAATLRNPALRVRGGNWRLYYFYGGLGGFAGVGSYGFRSEVPFEDKRDMLAEWAEAEPRSSAARIALAQLYLRAGWAARGEGLTDETSLVQWLGLALGVEQAGYVARGVIGGDAVASVHDNDPQAYQVLLDIAMGRGDRRQMDALYAAAAAAHPSWYNYYSFRANYLQPKWYGEPGELADFVRSLLQSPGGDDGKIAQSYAAYVLGRNVRRSELFETTGLSWPAVRDGYALREARWGLRSRDWNALLNLAVAAGDRPAAERALAAIGDDWSPLVWRSEDAFLRVADWVRSR